MGEPVTIASAIASATPILLKVKDILAKSGIKTEDVAKLTSAVKKGSEDFKSLTGKSVTDIIFKKEQGTDSSSKATYNSKDLAPTDIKDAKTVVEGALALSSGTDVKTIRDMALTVTDKPAPDSPVVTKKPVPASPFEFPKLTQKTLLIGASIVAVILLLRKKA